VIIYRLTGDGPRCCQVHDASVALPSAT